MPSLSPKHPDEGRSSMASSPSQGNSRGSVRPAHMKRHSSAASTTSAKSRGDAVSPGSHEGHHPLQHKKVKPGGHRRMILPRNHSSGRNLARLAQQVQRQTEAEVRAKQVHRRSHEGDTEIRLPGSLDEDRSVPPPQPAMKRNMTAYNLPRNASNAKLKKNLSHGQLNRLHSGRNLTGMTSVAQKSQLSPGPKVKGKRPTSVDHEVEKDLHEQEMELLEQQRSQKEKPKKVGFAVGSVGESSDEDSPDMEGSGMQEDEWTEDSASASPYGTRQNTANSSRRASMTLDKPPDKPHFKDQTWQAKQKAHLEKAMASAKKAQAEAEETHRLQQEDENDAVIEDDDDADADEDDSEGPSPSSTPHAKANVQESKPEPVKETFQLSPRADRKSIESRSSTDSQASTTESSQQQTASQPASESAAVAVDPPETKSVAAETTSKAKITSPLAAAKSQPDPTRRLLNQRGQLPAPALVSNISALDDVHSARESPAASLQSSRSNLADQEQEELVSRFLPTGSHPSLGSGANTAYNTPKQGGFHAPEEEYSLAGQNGNPRTASYPGVAPVSPGSTMSGSSGAATPATHRSRIDMKMALEKHQAKLESEAERQPLIPVYVYDRRNESLKSWLNLANLNDSNHHAADRPGAHLAARAPLGPELFQGRFKAVNQELKVVQKYRDPLRDIVSRLRQCKGSKLNELRSSQLQSSPQKPPGQHQAAALRLTKSAVSLPVRQTSKLSTSGSPPMGKSISPAKSGLHMSMVPPTTTGLSSSPGGSILESNTNHNRGPPKRAVSFKETSETKEIEARHDGTHDDDTADGPRSSAESQREDDATAIAEQLWKSVSTPVGGGLANNAGMGMGGSSTALAKKAGVMR